VNSSAIHLGEEHDSGSDYYRHRRDRNHEPNREVSPRRKAGPFQIPARSNQGTITSQTQHSTLIRAQTISGATVFLLMARGPCPASTCSGSTPRERLSRYRFKPSPEGFVGINAKTDPPCLAQL
jgi:hypothetical protein